MGPGKFRGGCGSHFVKEARTPTYVSQYIVNQRHIHPGIAGGVPGSPDVVHMSTGTEREVVVSPAVTGHLLETGDQLVYDFGGGGGWGDPLERDIDARARRRVGRVRLGRRSPASTTASSSRGRSRRWTSQSTTGHKATPGRTGENGERRMTRGGPYRIGVDVGGTFTDCVLLRPDGSVILEKTPTTPEDQSDGVLAGIGRLAEAEGLADVTALLRALRLDRARHDDGGQHHDPDVGSRDRAHGHRGIPRRDRDAAVLQRGHLGSRVPGAGAHRPSPVARRRVRLESASA